MFLRRGNSPPASGGAHSTRGVPSAGDAEQTRRKTQGKGRSRRERSFRGAAEGAESARRNSLRFSPRFLRFLRVSAVNHAPQDLSVPEAVAQHHERGPIERIAVAGGIAHFERGCPQGVGWGKGTQQVPVERHHQAGGGG